MSQTQTQSEYQEDKGMFIVCQIPNERANEKLNGKVKYTGKLSACRQFLKKHAVLDYEWEPVLETGYPIRADRSKFLVITREDKSQKYETKA